jgi:hypothetical protein
MFYQLLINVSIVKKKYFFNFTYPLRCLRVPQVEYH